MGREKGGDKVSWRVENGLGLCRLQSAAADSQAGSGGRKGGTVGQSSGQRRVAGRAGAQTPRLSGPDAPGHLQRPPALPLRCALVVDPCTLPAPHALPQGYQCPSVPSAGLKSISHSAPHSSLTLERCRPLSRGLHTSVAAICGFVSQAPVVGPK